MDTSAVYTRREKLLVSTHNFFPMSSVFDLMNLISQEALLIVSAVFAIPTAGGSPVFAPPTAGAVQRGECCSFCH